jgi:uncharacterized protein YfiM (DUF2279 family)
MRIMFGQGNLAKRLYVHNARRYKMKRLLLMVVVLSMFAAPAFAIQEDKKLHFGVGFGIGAGASVIAHVAGRETRVNLYLKSMVVASVIYVGKEALDSSTTGFSMADLAFDYAGHTVGFWVMQPVNHLLFGESAYNKHMITISDKGLVSYMLRF